MKQLSALTALALVAALSAPALAQPGAEPPPDYPGSEEPPVAQPDRYPPQQPRAPRTIRMTPEERTLLLRGEIDPNLHVAGGLVGLFIPFGVGSAVQGRWHTDGWKFTLGEGVSLALLIAGAVRLSTTPLGEDEDGGDVLMVVGGALGFATFWIWEMIDNWVGPALHNEKVRRLHYKYGIAPGLGVLRGRRRTSRPPARAARSLASRSGSEPR